MPIYDYNCSNCGQTTEVIHGIDADPPRFCPSCGAEGTLRKAFAAPAVVFKGSGWAKKDRSSSSSGSKAKASSATSDKGESGAKPVDSGSASSGSESSGASKPAPKSGD